jgi:alpha-1,6-mannosyltransferase
MMSSSRITLPDLVLLASILIHLFLCPYTKVEESFNMQAGHDLLNFNFLTDLKSFDHLEFSGVVPRTFVGAIVVTLVSYPLRILVDVASPSLGSSLLCAALVYRASLALMVWISFCFFRNALYSSIKFSSRTSSMFSVLLAMQFHIPYYASRSLPNTFALAVVMIAYGYWFRNKPTTCLYCIGVATVLFRCDMLVLLAPMALQMLLCEGISFPSTLVRGVAVCVITIAVSSLVDSYFWTRPLWPEGEVFFFNTVENRSSEWGTFPFHWYFSAALPKALHTTVPLVLVGLLNPYRNSRNERTTVWYYLCPTLCFLVLYSFLPHKELRFVFPAIPLFTLAAARGLDSLLPLSWFSCEEPTGTPSHKSSASSGRLYRIGAFVFLLGFAGVSLSVTSVFSLASQHNYPGGEALSRLNNHLLDIGLSRTCADRGVDECVDIGRDDSEASPAAVRVHIDAAAAMSGINRYCSYYNTTCLLFIYLVEYI